MVKKQSHRFILIVGIILTVLGIVGLIIKTDIIERFHTDPFIVLTVTVGTLIVGIVYVLYVYLQGGFLSKVEQYITDEEQIKQYLDQFADRFISRIENIENIEFNEEEMRSLILDKVKSITSETIMEEVEQNYGSTIQEDTKYRDLFKDFTETKRRLENETFRIYRNSNINLLIGVTTTGMAIFFLAYSLLGIDSKNSDTIIWNFIPRITLSIFVELFSFFFLKLYKRNIEDIKYFSNEKTNIDLKLIALKTSLFKGDLNMVKETVTNLCKTERNFILKKGESTIDLTRNDSESRFYIKTIENLTNILNKQ